MTRRPFRLVSLVLVTAVAACNADGNGGGGGLPAAAGDPVAVHFEGALQALPDLDLDTGWLPANSPIQVRVRASAKGQLTASADALVAGSAGAPAMMGKAGSGKLDIAVSLVLEVLLKVDFAAVSYEGRLSEDTTIDFKIAGGTTFDPFLLDGKATATADIPRTEMARIPLAASIPLVTGDVVIHVSGTVTSSFRGQCAAVSGTEAHYIGDTETSADLVLEPSVEIKIPLALDEKLEPFAIPVKVPALARALDLGTQAVTPLGVLPGAATASVGSCSAGGDADAGGGSDTAAPSSDTGGADAPPADDTGGGASDGSTPDDTLTADAWSPGDTAAPSDGTGSPDTAVGPDTTGPTCSQTCLGCCAGDTCVPAPSDSACGKGGHQCVSCGAGTVCQAGSCQPISQACADTCAGCCNGETCVAAVSAQACGTGGWPCEVCIGGVACSAGSCQVDPAGLWDVIAIDAAVTGEAPTGGWDIGFGKPDLFAWFGTDYSEASGFGIFGVTTQKDDTLTATWNEVVLTGVPASVLLETGLSVELFDADVSFDDSITSCSFVVGPGEMTGAPMPSCGTFGMAEIRYKLVPTP